MHAFVYPATRGIAQHRTGGRSDRVGRERLIVGGKFLQRIALVVMAFVHRLGTWLVTAAVLGVGPAMVYPTLPAAVGDVAHPAWRGTARGCTGTGAMPGVRSVGCSPVHGSMPSPCRPPRRHWGCSRLSRACRCCSAWPLRSRPSGAVDRRRRRLGARLPLVARAASRSCGGPISALPPRRRRFLRRRRPWTTAGSPRSRRTARRPARRRRAQAGRGRTAASPCRSSRTS